MTVTAHVQLCPKCGALLGYSIVRVSKLAGVVLTVTDTRAPNPCPRCNRA